MSLEAVDPLDNGAGTCRPMLSSRRQRCLSTRARSVAAVTIFETLAMRKAASGAGGPGQRNASSQFLTSCRKGAGSRPATNTAARPAAVGRWPWPRLWPRDGRERSRRLNCHPFADVCHERGSRTGTRPISRRTNVGTRGRRSAWAREGAATERWRGHWSASALAAGSRSVSSHRRTRHRDAPLTSAAPQSRGARCTPTSKPRTSLRPGLARPRRSDDGRGSARQDRVQVGVFLERPAFG